MKKKLLLFLICITFVSAVLYSHADQIKPMSPTSKPTVSYFSILADVIFARPALIATTIAGAAVFVVTLPFSAVGGNLEEAREVLVQQPLRATFKRCLGCAFE